MTFPNKAMVHKIPHPVPPARRTRLVLVPAIV